MPDPTIHPRAPLDDRPADVLHLRPDRKGSVRLDPARAGWRYLSFESRLVSDAETTIEEAPGQETCVVVLGGRDVTIEAGADRWQLEGRDSPFADLPSALWLPDGRELRVRIGSGPGSIAIARAPRSERDGVASDPIVVRPADVVVEIRGAGNATRQINHIVAPSFPADRLEVVEVLTPSGNWSSWPPHKHDVDDMPGEAVLEEIYHYRFARPEAWALQRVYRGDRSRDGIWEVRDGDVVLVPDGYHPFTAAHGDDAYYLNALAGDRRTMACSFDPDLDWVRETWASMEPDPRVPLVRSVGSGLASGAAARG
ncbi:MAG TPA: 5-deoxy-glucuronate isomerase [Candidatus Limnocylindrales bacterium]|nr:5-deoxy-glucuronate isomerase [Candidatus Limnocylindrales bacterium]